MGLTRRQAIAAGACLTIPSALFAIDHHEDPVRFKAKTLDGENLSTESVHGKIVLIQFWATWCPYCKSDAPFVDSLHREFVEEGLEVLAVDLGETKRTVTKYLVQYPRDCKIVLLEDTNLAAWFGPRSLPHYVAIDRNGVSVAEQKGAGGDRSLRRLLHQAGLQTGDSGGPAGELRSSPRRS